MRGARWGLDYLDLLRDIWASELTSHSMVIREHVIVDCPKYPALLYNILHYPQRIICYHMLSYTFIYYPIL